MQITTKIFSLILLFAFSQILVQKQKVIAYVKTCDKCNLAQKIDLSYSNKDKTINKCAFENTIPIPQSEKFDIELVKVEGGTFTMGCTAEQGKNCEDFEKPAHQVMVDNFFIGKFEVTQKLWRSVMGTNPSYFTGCDDCPVEQVNWDDVRIFIKRLNDSTGKNYRLPTEAEWEFAARGGNLSKGYKYVGSNNIGDVAWYLENSKEKTHPVGQKQANELGIYDMGGNVREWCSDWFYDYSNANQVNPTGPSLGTLHVLRGGSWNKLAVYCRTTYRIRNSNVHRDNNNGLRLVLSETP